MENESATKMESGSVNNPFNRCKTYFGAGFGMLDHKDKVTLFPQTAEKPSIEAVITEIDKMSSALKKKLLQNKKTFAEAIAEIEDLSD